MIPSTLQTHTVMPLSDSEFYRVRELLKTMNAAKEEIEKIDGVRVEQNEDGRFHAVANRPATGTIEPATEEKP